MFFLFYLPIKKEKLYFSSELYNKTFYSRKFIPFCDKLECLSLWVTSIHMFVVEARNQPKEWSHLGKIWPCSKYGTRIEVKDSDKHPSLLQCGINYDRKMFYRIDPWYLIYYFLSLTLLLEVIGIKTFCPRLQ